MRRRFPDFASMLLVGAMLAFLALPSTAVALERVTLLLSESGGVYEEFADAFDAALAAAGSPLRGRRLALPEAGEGAPAAGEQLILAVGSQAMRAAAAWNSPVPVLNVLVPQQAHERLAADALRRRPVQAGNAFSAIWLDQPPSRLVALFRQVVPEARRVGAILGPDSAAQLTALKAAVERGRLELFVETVSRESEVMPALAKLLPSVDGIVALPDGVVYRRETVRGILLTTYRHQKPLFAFSQSYVNAGAVAAVFSTPSMAGLQAAEIVLGQVAAGRLRLPPPQYPAYPSVAINRQVARSLGLDLPADALIQKAIERASEKGSER